MEFLLEITPLRGYLLPVKAKRRVLQAAEWILIGGFFKSMEPSTLYTLKSKERPYSAGLVIEVKD